MCGLAGFSGKNKVDITKLKFLLYWNSIERGLDATGIFTPETGILKDNSKAELFINDKVFKEKQDIFSNTVIGHVRAKTLGANTVKNAHPFKYNRIIAAHNGTLKNHLSLCKDYGLAINDFDVDSQVLTAALNIDFEEDKDRFKVLSKYDGAAALLIYDEYEDSLYACHDNQRPLYYGHLNNGEDMYISSIKDSLEAIECEKITEFPINTVHKIKEGKIVGTYHYETYKVVLPVIGKIADYSDITIDKDDNMTIAAGCKGVTFHLSRARLFEGRWVQINSLFELSKDDFKLNDWYLCKDVKEGLTRHLDKLILIDDNNMDKEVGLRHIDNANFIPVVNSYIALTYDITNTVDKVVKSVGKYGDMCLVQDYLFGEDSLRILNLETGKSIRVYLNCVRNLDYEERVEAFRYHEVLKAAKKTETKQGPTILKLDGPPKIEQVEDNADSPFVEKIEDDFEEVEEDFREEDYLIELSKYIDHTLETIEAAEEIEMELNNRLTALAQSKLTALINRLKSNLVNVEYEAIN